MKNLLCCILFVIVAVGCGKPSVVGNYKIDVPPTSFAKLSLELRADKTFIMPEAKTEGTYTVEGDTVELTTTKLVGIDMSSNPQKSKLKVEPGGKRLTALDKLPISLDNATAFVRVD